MPQGSMDVASLAQEGDSLLQRSSSGQGQGHSCWQVNSITRGACCLHMLTAMTLHPHILGDPSQPTAKVLEP